VYVGFSSVGRQGRNSAKEKERKDVNQIIRQINTQKDFIKTKKCAKTGILKDAKPFKIAGF
jgi:hypothetical protein